MAALLLLERLTPLERAVFVLRDVFGFSFPEIASAVGRSEAACRQLAVRARRHMDAGRPRFEAGRKEREEDRATVAPGGEHGLDPISRIGCRHDDVEGEVHELR